MCSTSSSAWSPAGSAPLPPGPCRLPCAAASCNRKQQFFGLYAGTECLLVVNRHTSSVSEKSVSRHDVYALMELAALVQECGARADIVPHNEIRQGLGDKAEFCIGGPASNSRTAAHLAWRFPGVRIDGDTTQRALPSEFQIEVGPNAYTWTAEASYVLLARISAGEGGRPAFLVSGQTATSNQAAAHYLISHHRQLMQSHGLSGTFCLILKVVQPGSYGPDIVELVGDVTAQASAPRPTPVPIPAE
ncbi:hypothetical protein [Streptacidiphilus sp. PAMC 29251]